MTFFGSAEHIICVFIAVLNVVTAIVLYRSEVRDGITSQSGSRRKAIRTCMLMCIIFGSLCIFLLLYDWNKGNF